MLLSVQQKYILETLRKLGCVQKAQLQALTQGKFGGSSLEITQPRLDAMLRQLRAGLGDFHAGGDFVSLAGSRPDAARLEAVDIMLALSESKPQDFTVRLEGPRILRFIMGGDKLKLFSVAGLSHASEPQLIRREQLERVVWISDSGEPPEGLVLPPKHFFAARQADGSHRFYGSNGP